MSIPSITATPAHALLPTEIHIRAAGFRAGEAVRLGSKLVDDVGVVWTAHGEYVADVAGAIDTKTAPSMGGTFTGTDPAGLLWSMRPENNADRSFMITAQEKAHKLGQPACDPLKPVAYELTASVDGEVRARSGLTLYRLDPGVEAVPVRDGRLRGICFRWKDRSRRRGAIMSLTGSGGGVEMGYAPVLASLGYDVLSLAYFAYEDLPPAITRIPLEYFVEGFEWMRRELGCERIAIQGASRGGELTLVLAAYLPEYVNGAIAIVPMYASSVGWDPAKGYLGSSWTYRGKEIPYAPPQEDTPLEEMRRIGEKEPNGFACTPEYRAAMEHPETRANAAIPVERASGPILMIAGVDDQMWPSAWGSDMVVNRLRAHGFPHAFSHLCLEETGHWTPLPNTVTTFTQAVFHSLAHVFLACGGTPAGTARTSRRTWEAMAAHYRTVLGH